MKDSDQIVVFKLGDELYGVSISKVKEIIEIKDISPLPDTPDYIEGLVNIRGDIHIIFNLGKRFQMDENEGVENSKIILANDRKAGFLVGEVSEIIHVESKDIESVHGLIPGADKEYIEGVAKVKEDIVVLLNLGRILSVEDEYHLETAEGIN